MKLYDIVKNFNTTPFLFIGSGFSRRYYNLPDWKQLLSIFIARLDADEFAFNRYESAANNLPGKRGSNTILATIASLVQRDFDVRWYDDPSFRMADGKYLEYIKAGASPFKVEVAQYIEQHSSVVPEMANELAKFQEISKRSVAGIITTNYDCLLEQHTDGYTTYTGQEELVFSALQGWAEIYKIHGSISNPSSIVITEEDYQNFLEYSPYLAAKLMTIFMEYPVIFMGYSLNDPNVKIIIEQIAKCLSAENLKRLLNRFVYIEYQEGCRETEIFEQLHSVGNGEIYMTGVRTDDFAGIYDALANKRASIPAKLVRMFKKEFYDFALTNKPTEKIYVAALDDDRINDEDLVLAIGKTSEFTIKGLSGITSYEWYRHVILRDLEYSPDNMLTYAFPQLDKHNAVLPLNMLLSEAKHIHTECEEKRIKTFDDAISNSYKKYRDTRNMQNRSIQGIIELHKDDYPKICYEIPFLRENEIDIDHLEAFLKKIYASDALYNSLNDNAKSNLRRVVRIYDYLKYGK